uniref:Uncharacterized protein n=1 Tax=Palpitomonas bilix TaxID=652834 RepID=A0A7S3LX74_9EUKA
MAALTAALSAFSVVSTVKVVARVQALLGPVLPEEDGRVPAPSDYLSFNLLRIWRLTFAVGKGAASVRAEAWSLLGRMARFFPSTVLKGKALFLFASMFGDGVSDIDSTVQLRVAKSIGDYVDGTASSLNSVLPSTMEGANKGKVLDIFGTDDDQYGDDTIERLLLGDEYQQHRDDALDFSSLSDETQTTSKYVSLGWTILLSEALPALLKSASPAVRSTAVAAISQLPTVLLDPLAPASISLAHFRIAVSKIVFDALRDKSGAVRTNALRALGVLVKSKWSRRNVMGLIPVTAAARKVAMEPHSGVSAKEKAFWALANVTDCLVASKAAMVMREADDQHWQDAAAADFHSITGEEKTWFQSFADLKEIGVMEEASVLKCLVRETLYVARKGLTLDGRVASQAARALGNLFRSPMLFKDVGIEEIGRAIDALLTSFPHQCKQPKCLWNIARAFSLLLRHCEVPLPPSQWGPKMVELMVNEIENNENFKVRIHGLEVLASIPSRTHLALDEMKGIELLQSALHTLFSCFDTGRIGGFEFDVNQAKYLSQLKEQAMKALVNLFEHTSPDDAKRCASAFHPRVVLPFVRGLVEVKGRDEDVFGDRGIALVLPSFFPVQRPRMSIDATATPPQDASPSSRSAERRAESDPSFEVSPISEAARDTLVRLSHAVASAGHETAGKELASLVSAPSQL